MISVYRTPKFCLRSDITPEIPGFRFCFVLFSVVYRRHLKLSTSQMALLISPPKATPFPLAPVSVNGIASPRCSHQQHQGHLSLPHPPAMQETQIRSLGWEDPLEKTMATHSSILAWRIPWIEKPGGLQCMGLQRVGHDWATNIHTHTLPHPVAQASADLPTIDARPASSSPLAPSQARFISPWLMWKSSLSYLPVAAWLSPDCPDTHKVSYFLIASCSLPFHHRDFVFPSQQPRPFPPQDLSLCSSLGLETPACVFSVWLLAIGQVPAALLTIPWVLGQP